jgi:plasmid stability protein
MRTTLTLDDDVAALLRQRASTLGVSFKEMVNRALRAGLLREMAPRDVPVPKTIPYSFGFRPDVDLDTLNQLADDLEAEATADSLARTRAV